jgi:hypothetical protein
VSEPACIDACEVHAEAIVDYAGAPATVVLVVPRGECLSGYSLAEWAEFGSILIRQDDGAADDGALQRRREWATIRVAGRAAEARVRRAHLDCGEAK